jgi:hypothetical protein
MPKDQTIPGTHSASDALSLSAGQTQEDLRSFLSKIGEILLSLSNSKNSCLEDVTCTTRVDPLGISIIVTCYAVKKTPEKSGQT